MRTAVVLDTSAYSQFCSGRQEVAELLGNATMILVPAIVVGELEAAFELGQRAKANRQLLSEFLAEPFVRGIDVTTAIARRYGEIFAALKRKGKPLPANNIWIAASALESSGILVTYDRDFERIDGLQATILEV